MRLFTILLQSETYDRFLVVKQIFTRTTIAIFHFVLAISAVSLVFDGDGEKLDINDASFLWPLVKTAADVDSLISLDDLGHDGEIVPEAVFTTDYRSEVYTETGLKWIAKTGMKEVILRHYPQLAPAFVGVSNPFAPWKS